MSTLLVLHFQCDVPSYHLGTVTFVLAWSLFSVPPIGVGWKVDDWWMLLLKSVFAWKQPFL